MLGCYIQKARWFVLFRHPIYGCEAWRVGWLRSWRGNDDDDKIWVMHVCHIIYMYGMRNIYFIYTIATSNKYLRCVFWIWTGVVACDETLEKFIKKKKKGCAANLLQFYIGWPCGAQEKVFFFLVWPLISSDFIIWCHWHFDFILIAFRKTQADD